MQVTLWHDRYTHNTHLLQTRKRKERKERKDTRKRNKLLHPDTQQQQRQQQKMAGSESRGSGLDVWIQSEFEGSSRVREREGIAWRACTRFYIFIFLIIFYLSRKRKKRKGKKKGKIWKKERKKKKRAISAGSAVWRPLNTAIIISLNVQSYRDSCGNHRFFCCTLFGLPHPSM